jgi:ATP phosphoribosyltransferase
MTGRVLLALPSKGMLAEPTLNFLRSCDLKVHQINPRQYTASIPALPQIDVLFQRVGDIVFKVADGTVHLGITGLDVVKEHPGNDLMVVHDALGFGSCELVLAVPETWLDVVSLSDVIDISLDFREHKRRNLRVATKFTNLTRRFLHENGLHHFTLVESEGALEAAPTLGYADVICDLTATGTTLRENHLKTVEGGTILKSQSCLIANRSVLQSDSTIRDTLRTLLELIDAGMQGRDYYNVTANISGVDPQAIADLVAQNPVTRGLQGPTIAPLFAPNSAAKSGNQWFTVTIMIRSHDLLATVEHLRVIGGRQTTVTPVRYVFLEQSPSYARLEALLDLL